MEKWIKEAQKAVFEKAKQTMEDLRELADSEHIQLYWVFERFMVEMRRNFDNEE